MPLGSFLLLVALLVLVALVVANPLMGPGEASERADSEASHWLAERERALDALAELDADHKMGKVPEEVYQEQRQVLLGQGAEALEHLDKLSKSKPKSKGGRAKGDDLDAMIAAYKKKKGRGQ